MKKIKSGDIFLEFHNFTGAAIFIKWRSEQSCSAFSYTCFSKQDYEANASEELVFHDKKILCNAFGLEEAKEALCNFYDLLPSEQKILLGENPEAKEFLIEILKQRKYEKIKKTR